jgi:hypothetical protein
MSTHNTLDEINKIEETLHGALSHELDSRSAQLRAAGLQVDLDPICRSGEGTNYVSYIEATLRYADGDVHDIVFFYVAQEGRLMVDPTSMPQWITGTLDESLNKVAG